MIFIKKNILLKELREKIRTMTEALLPDERYYMVDLIISGNKNNLKVKALIDSDEGLDIDVCAAISRSLSDKIDELDLIQSKYLLEVSSPGVDFPLQLKRQYKKNIGRDLKAVLNDGKTHQGELIEAAGDYIILREVKGKESREISLPYDQIKSAKVLVSFKK